MAEAAKPVITIGAGGGFKFGSGGTTTPAAPATTGGFKFGSGTKFLIYTIYKHKPSALIFRVHKICTLSNQLCGRIVFLHCVPIGSV